MLKKYRNALPVYVSYSRKDFFKSLGKMFDGKSKKTAQHKIPVKPLPVLNYDPVPQPDASLTKIIWFGHSTLYIELDGKRLLLDPNFSRHPFPLIPRFGGSRFSTSLPFEPQQLPEIDLVILSHDHYDHLDKVSIKALHNRVKVFCCPSGVPSRLKSWGIKPEKIYELGWNQSANIAGLQLQCTPARHFSGRYLIDRDSTLWCSWTIAGQTSKLFFSGDGGYEPHFSEIGNKYGPFDIALMECGQYDKRWPVTHMIPEQSVQACADLNCPVMLPIHWGGFGMGASHPWYEPPERALAAAAKFGIKLCTPLIGEPVIPGKYLPDSRWWRTFK